MAMYNRKPIHKGSSKCFVLALSVFVILCALLLVFASVLRPRNPRVKLRSATFNKITYSASPSSPSFNATLIISLTITNPNYGPFTYNNAMITVLHEAVKIGQGKIRAHTLRYKEIKEINITVNVKSAKVPVTANLSSDINSGLLKLTSYAKFSGTVHLLKIINMRKTVEMGCAMTLHFTSHAIQGIQCQ